MKQATQLLNGKQLSDSLIDEIAQEVQTFSQKTSHTPTLAVILVGDNPSSKTYVQMKAKACKRVGINSITYEISDNTSQEEIIIKIEDLNNAPHIDGILVQLPLPKNIDEEAIIKTIATHKDVDGFTPFNTGALWTKTHHHTSFSPATPLGIIELIKHYNIPIKGQDVVIVGASNIVGKPLAGLFLQEEATITLCHIHTKELSSHTQRADILCVGVGQAKMITADMVKEGVIIIDIGINKVGDTICGDVDFDKVKEKASFITPVPGGVGPMTISTLLKNTLKSAKNNHQART